MTEEAKTKRGSIYVKADVMAKANEINKYLRESGSMAEAKNFSQTVSIAIETFYTLFLTNASGNLDYHERYAQLSTYSNSLLDEIRKENRQLKRQIDQLTYLMLANFHTSTNPEWDVEELESVSSSYDAEQRQLLDHIEKLIKSDKERAQTIKHSHTK